MLRIVWGGTRFYANYFKSCIMGSYLIIYKKIPCELIRLKDVPISYSEFIYLKYILPNFYLPDLFISYNLIVLKAYNLKEYKGKSGIYLWFNRINYKYYIGSAINLFKRISEYYNPSRLNSKFFTQIIYRSIDKYHHDSFILIFLHIFDDKPSKELLLNKEQFFIDYCKPPYNMNKSAYNSQGRILSQETKDKIRLALLGINKNFTESHRINLSKSQLGNKKRNKIVYLYSKEGIFIRSFDSIYSISSFFKISRSTTYRHLKENKVFRDLYYFRFPPKS